MVDHTCYLRTRGWGRRIAEFEAVYTLNFCPIHLSQLKHEARITQQPLRTLLTLKRASSILWSRLILWSPVWPRAHFPSALASNVRPQQAINTQFLANTKQFKKNNIQILSRHLPVTAPWRQTETEHKPVKTRKFYENTSWRHQGFPHSVVASGYTVSSPRAFRNSYKYGYSHTPPPSPK